MSVGEHTGLLRTQPVWGRSALSQRRGFWPQELMHCCFSIRAGLWVCRLGFSALLSMGRVTRHRRWH